MRFDFVVDIIEQMFQALYRFCITGNHGSETPAE
jgi:hypothetical protein